VTALLPWNWLKLIRQRRKECEVEDRRKFWETARDMIRYCRFLKEEGLKS
jgi:hypothetical protein